MTQRKQLTFWREPFKIQYKHHSYLRRQKPEGLASSYFDSCPNVYQFGTFLTLLLFFKARKGVRSGR